MTECVRACVRACLFVSLSVFLAGYHNKARFYALNVLEFLDSPGEVSFVVVIVVLNWSHDYYHSSNRKAESPKSDTRYVYFEVYSSTHKHKVPKRTKNCTYASRYVYVHVNLV